MYIYIYVLRTNLLLAYGVDIYVTEEFPVYRKNVFTYPGIVPVVAARESFVNEPIICLMPLLEDRNVFVSRYGV